MQVVLDVLGILLIIGFGAFLIVFVADFILSLFDKHEGIFFNKKKKKDETPVEPAKPQTKVVYHSTENPKLVVKENKQEEQQVVKTAEVLATNPPLEQPQEVDMVKAEEEERLLRSKMQEVNKFDDFGTISAQKEEPVSDKEDDLSKVLPKILKRALNEIAREKPAPEPVVEEPKPSVKPKIIYKSKPEVVEEEKEVNELEKIKNDVIAIKKSALLNKGKAKPKAEPEPEKEEDDEIVTTTTRKIKVVDDKTKQEIQRLKAERLNFASEKLELIKKQEEETEKSRQLARQNEELETELAKLKEETETSKKPYYTKAYYENRLENLENELKEAEKELKANKKEYLPLARVKKSFERDSEKLRRKEAIVAKQRMAVYGVNNSSNIDEAKRKKFDEDDKLLKELKESVYNCEQVLNKNKDRLPVLEKANKLLTKNVDKINKDIASTKEALLWYEQNEK